MTGDDAIQEGGMKQEQFLRCGQCDGIIAIAKVYGEKSLVCHCTHDDGSLERASLDGEEPLPRPWGWES